jgi:hypothetical protein
MSVVTPDKEMELDEAIDHAKEAAHRLAKEGCDECSREHAQLAEWLEELRRLRQGREECG